MQEILLKVENLSVRLDQDNLLLKNVSFDIKKGETFALLGESGSGKSLTALSIARLLTDNIGFQSGKIWFDGQDLLQLPEIAMRQVRGRRIAFIFQEPMNALNPVMTAGQQIMEGLRLHRKLTKNRAREITLELLSDVGLIDIRRIFLSYPHQLSGGMNQRIMIAMALAGNPDLLIADEPTTALDVTVQAQVLELLKSLQKKFGMTMLFISHDLALLSNIADRLAVMKDGEVIDIATPTDFFLQPKHDYSKHLIEVVPTADKRGKLLLDKKADGYSKSYESDKDQALLEVENLKVYFPIRSGLLNRTTGWVKAVDGVSLTLAKGQTLAIIGESGSGKTTIARAILRLINIYSGQIRFAGHQIDHLKVSKLLPYRRKIQIIWQDPFSSLNPKMTIGEIIRESISMQGGNTSKKYMDGYITDVLREVGFETNIINRYPHEFSGGQRQRICIARALAVEPELLICDEPTSALDVSVQAQILDLFQTLQRNRGLSYLFITHDIATVSYLAHSVSILYQGKIIESGDTLSILNTPQKEYTQELFASVPTLQMA